ncbi:hypothetical protein LCGC14_2520010 [marine sediment metagenome]|uniref:Uncharacterized protein n=1 Tax=marine sediment metagenome TaxID=412755 RepID=A0A0F9AX36_9ZZZZ
MIDCPSCGARSHIGIPRCGCTSIEKQKAADIIERNRKRRLKQAKAEWTIWSDHSEYKKG